MKITKKADHRFFRSLYLWVALPMADSPRIESRLRVILAGGAVANLTAPQWRRARWSAAAAVVLFVGGAAAVRPVAAQKHREVAAVDRERGRPRESGVPRNYINSLPPNPRWMRSAFGGKVSLELVGVSQRKDGPLNPPYGNDPYTRFPLDSNDAHRILTKSWSPDGLLYPQPLYLAGVCYSSDVPHWRIVEYAMRVRSKGVSDLDFTDYGFNPTGATDGFQESDGIWRAYGITDPGDRKAHLKFLVSGGPYPWHVDFNVDFQTDIMTPDFAQATVIGKKDVYIHFTGPVYNAKGDYGFVISCSKLPYNLRVVAVDKAGREFTESEGESSGDGSTPNGFTHLSAFFDPKKLSKERICQVRLEARPYQTVDFGNVALYPAKGIGR